MGDGIPHFLGYLTLSDIAYDRQVQVHAFVVVPYRGPSAIQRRHRSEARVRREKPFEYGNHRDVILQWPSSGPFRETIFGGHQFMGRHVRMFILERRMDIFLGHHFRITI